MNEATQKLDELIRRDFISKWKRALGDSGTQEGTPPEPHGESVSIPSSTAEELWVRLSADWTMVKNHAESRCAALNVMPSPGRVYYGSIINDDEFYNKAREFKLLANDRVALNDITDHQSTFNLFAATGQIRRTTKTQGSLGMSTTKKVTAGGVSNLHPSTGVPMQQKKCGQHVCAALDRMTFVTQRPVRPHDPLPQDLVLPPTADRWRWIECSAEVMCGQQMQEDSEHAMHHAVVSCPPSLTTCEALLVLYPPIAALHPLH